MKLAKLAKKITDLSKNNIALVGHMGSGKSVIGKLISNQLSFKHIDTDTEIEKYVGKKINEIFKIYGEQHFRKLEEKIVLEIVNKSKIILSLGGGSILNSKIRNALKSNCLTIFLDVNFDILEKRLKNSRHRPLLKNTNIRKKITELDIIRRKYYLLADITLTKHTSVADTLSDLNEKYLEYYEKNN